MFQQYLEEQNFLALFVSGLLYWAIGSVWFSALFGKIWMAELEQQGVKIEKPDKKEFTGMMLGTFIYNMLIAFAMSYIIFISGSVKLMAALKMGALLGTCLVWTTIGITYTWEKRSMRHLAIDAGYHFLGVMVCAIILALWRK